MRLTDLWLRPKARQAVWLALAAVCLGSTLLLLLFFNKSGLSWDSVPGSDSSRLHHHHHHHNNNNNNKNDKTPGYRGPVDRRCQALADPGNVQFVVKTGATEVYEKLPTQLLTTLGCVDDFLIFSDLDEQIGPYRIRDTLADFNASLKASLPDFQLYRLQQEFRRTGQDMATLKGEAAWKLDKYKFLHLVEKTWLERPNKDWYFFIETDTYVVWSSLVLWLRSLSPPPRDEPLYLGSVAYVENRPFAHGGSGFLISGPLLQRFVAGNNTGLANEYDHAFDGNCCGDSVLANTIHAELNVTVKNLWPQINGEKPSTIPFGPTHWCQPVVTMHHLHPRERTAIFDFEQTRPDLTTPLTFAELSYLPFPADSPRTFEEDWDNLSNIRIVFSNGATPTLESCRDACLGLPDCFQYRFSEGECDVSTMAFRLGAKRMPDENGRRWVSGWNLEYIRNWREMNPCEGVEWVGAR